MEIKITDKEIEGKINENKERVAAAVSDWLKEDTGHYDKIYGVEKNSGKIILKIMSNIHKELNDGFSEINKGISQKSIDSSAVEKVVTAYSKIEEINEIMDEIGYSIEIHENYKQQIQMISQLEKNEKGYAIPEKFETMKISNNGKIVKVSAKANATNPSTTISNEQIKAMGGGVVREIEGGNSAFEDEKSSNFIETFAQLGQDMENEESAPRKGNEQER